jgi:hypothetical protein
MTLFFQQTEESNAQLLGITKRKKAPDPYPLFCTIAQTGQFFDFRHRSGNVHDSNGEATG